MPLERSAVIGAVGIERIMKILVSGPINTTLLKLGGAVRRQKTFKALSDLINGFQRYELYLTLGWNDIKQRYRRSAIGPFWITISLGAMIGGLGFLYGALFGQPIDDYLPYLAVGLIVWALISGIINDGCLTFIAASELISQQPCPFSVQAYRILWRNLLVFCHNFIIYPVLLILFSFNPGWTVLASLFGLVIICLNGLWLSLLLGMLSLRFRDIPPISATLVQLVFFMTPIIWTVDTLPQEMSYIFILNPFYYMLEVMRAPLLGEFPDWSVWLPALAITFFGLVTSFCFFVEFRRRIPYWV